MRPQQLDRLDGRSNLQGDANSWMGMLKFSDDFRQQICTGERRRCDRDGTSAALAELGGAEARLHQEGLGPKHMVRNEVTSTRERAVPLCPLHEFESQYALQFGDVF